MPRDGKEITGKKPNVFITDGAENFHKAYKNEFWTLKSPRTKHIQYIHFKGDKNNNKMERMNGEIRDREKVMRRLKKEDTQIIEGYKIFHNYVRSHQSLDGKTPAEASGIKIEGDNKWITLIQTAHVSKVNTNKNHIGRSHRLPRTKNSLIFINRVINEVLLNENK